MEEILERPLIIRGRAFATFSTIEKALACRKKSFRGPYVVQACPAVTTDVWPTATTDVWPTVTTDVWTTVTTDLAFLKTESRGVTKKSILMQPYTFVKRFDK